MKPHVSLIKIISNFNGAHFDEKFITFGVASCIMALDPIFRMALFCKISSWNHISNYYTVLNPCNLTCWQLTPLHYTGVLYWMAFSTLYSMKMIFWYHSNLTHYWNFVILYIMRHFTDTTNAIMTSWNMWSWWSPEVGTPTLGKRPFLD